MTSVACLTLLLLAAPPDAAAVSRMPNAANLARVHELLASEPHVAGTPGDARTIERLVAEFRAMGISEDGTPLEGFEVEVQEFFPLLARPVRAKLEIVAPAELLPQAQPSAPGARRGVLALGVTEPNLAIDPATAHPDLDIAWNAWSGSGVAEAGVVYVNYGRKEDFEQLASLGVDPRGKIALARYGGNFRGYKAKFAEAAGCVGLVIFTDPADSGDKRGKTWPDGGGWANPECIQRGSLITLPYVGDPLTPGVFASEGARRLDESMLRLPKIPVQPIGYGAAAQILARMKGPEAPEAWRGGLPCGYRLTDDALRLRMEVEQTREVTRTANVIARLRGATLPDEEVIVGAHHDAWCFGAADPLAGTICMLESARNFCELARRGERPDRTLVFCAWGAEEYGIFGSSEFVERDAEGLARRAVAYINLDMAAMGLKPGAGVSPTLRARVDAAIAAAPGARGEGSALDAWGRGADGSPSYGDLGGGSDHVAFWCHAGIPSIALSAGGGEGTSYHSNYDTVAWYRSVVGDDYASARLVTGITSAMVAELAGRERPPISALALVRDAAIQARRIEKLATERGWASGSSDLASLARSFEELGPAAVDFDAALESGAADPNAARQLVRVWHHRDGLRGRPWFRNLYAATDRNSGYGTSGWPLLREAVEDFRPDDPATVTRCEKALGEYRTVLGRVRDILSPRPEGDGARTATERTRSGAASTPEIPPAGGG
jgi:N-acetylated-alpha-linked acidic dipeptidase